MYLFCCLTNRLIGAFFLFSFFVLRFMSFHIRILLQRMEYAIVEFTDDKSVAVVSTNWLSVNVDHDVCCWPPLSKAKTVEKLVKEQAEPASDWMKFSVRVLHRYGILFFPVNTLPDVVIFAQLLEAYCSYWLLVFGKCHVWLLGCMFFNF